MSARIIGAMPIYDLSTAMRIAGEAGYHVEVKYNPERHVRHFTVLLDDILVGDGDDPIVLVLDGLRKLPPKWRGE